MNSIISMTEPGLYPEADRNAQLAQQRMNGEAEVERDHESRPPTTPFQSNFPKRVPPLA